MVDQLKLPFPFLSDPDRTLAIRPFGVADERDPREIAIPTSILLAPGGDEVYRRLSTDFADRPTEDALVQAAQQLGIGPTTQEPPELGTVTPGDKAFDIAFLPSYLRGAKFAARAMSIRYPDAKETSKAYGAQMDRYIEALRAHLG